MTSKAPQVARATLFKNLHVKGDPLVLFNIWDAGSARAIQETGAKAIATGSWSVAAAYGYADREELPFELALANVQRITRSVDLPVTVDLESGYGRTPSEVQASVSRVIEAGAVGINFEDQVIQGEGLYSVGEQCARIEAIRSAAEEASIPLFINARTDIFLKAALAHREHLEDALQRALAYASAGANGFFAPGLSDPDLIARLCELAPVPVNIMVTDNTPPSKQLAQLGVARISYGPRPYRQMIEALKAAGRMALLLG